MAEGRHAGKPDTVGHLPKGFPGGVVADADHSVAVRFPKLGRVGEHSLGEGGRTPVKPVADGALPAVDVGANLQVGGAGFDRRRLYYFPVDARVQGKVDDPLFKGKRRVAW